LTALLTTVVRWLLRHALVLLLVVAVLLLGRAGWAEWRDFQRLRAESAELEHQQTAITADLQAAAAASTRRANALRDAPLERLEAQITAVDREIAQLRLERQAFSGLAPLLAGQPVAQTQLRALQIDARIGLLERERSWLQALKLRLVALQSAQQQRAELERLRQRHQQLYTQWQATGTELDWLDLRHPVKSRVFGTTEYQLRQQLLARRQQLLADNQQADTDYKRQLARVNSPPLPPLAPFAVERADIATALAPLNQALGALQQQSGSNWVGKLWRPVQEVLADALLIVLGIILGPVAIKALFYFVLAPLAARRPPVRLLPMASGALALQGSAVSLAVPVDAGHELLVKPEFLQSTATAGNRATQWLLNARFPLTSVASGMVALTRLRADAPQSVTISATRDAFSEVGMLTLDAGAALVMQPHNLIGVLQRRGEPVAITSHWRLNSLHAWLTLQLRYLAFHGPAQLIVQGCRGVRIERADGGRAINQAATIGFSANVAYATRRCETFVAYLTGRQALLNDCFGERASAVAGPGAADAAPEGFYVYEEMPHVGKKAGITGRGLEGLTDSLLKVFGV